METLSLLLVDDDPDVCNLLKMKLSVESSDFSIHVAYSAEEGLDYLKQGAVDCILSDYQMPGMNGMELLYAVKELGQDIPFIFVTGQGNEDVAREAFKNGASDYFTKDVSGFAFASRMANSIRQSVTRRRWTSDILRKAAEGVPLGSGERFFSSLARFIADTLQVDIAFVGELSEGAEKVIQTLSVYAHGHTVENFSYSLADTPCETVVDNRPCIYPKNVQKLFPNDEMLVQMGLESYAGVPLYDSSGRPIGILVVVHSKPITNEELVRTLLLILADRASVELERVRAEKRRAGYETIKATIDAIELPMVIIKPGHELYMMNRAAREELFHGVENSGASRLKCYSVLHNLDRPCRSANGHSCPVEEVFSTGKTIKSFHEHVLSDGQAGEVEMVASPLFSDNGEIHAVVEVFNKPGN